MEDKMKNAGETDLALLLKSLKPELNESDYVFCTVPNLDGCDLSEVVGMMREAEGATLVVKKEYADANRLKYTSVMAWITLKVHSSLEAVGLTAAFSNALAQAGVSCNVLAGTYHDHIFVPRHDAEKAMRVLEQLSNFGDGKKT